MFLKKENKSLNPKEYAPDRKEKPQDLCVSLDVSSPCTVGRLLCPGL